MSCSCREEYKCSSHRTEPKYARAIQFSGSKKVLITRHGDGIEVTLAFTMEEAAQLLIELQRAIKAY